MSELLYVYPRDPARWSLSCLLHVLQDDGFSVEQCERRRGVPDWSCLLLTHARSERLRVQCVLAKNTTSQINGTVARYVRHRNIRVVQNAKQFVWTQLLFGGAVERELTMGFETIYRVVAILVKLSRGIVDLPESGKLYCSAGLSRYMTVHRLRG